MIELERKISKLIQENQPITESEAQDLATLICELPEISGNQSSGKRLIISIENDTVLFKNLNEFKPLEFIGILHNAISTADVMYKTKVMRMVEKASKSEYE